MVRVAIALGSNVGDAETMVRRALGMLECCMQIESVSSLYRTAPMYVQDQDAFVNAALVAQTDLGPLPLLNLLKRTERVLGRMPRERYGPREIDLDLITYGSLIYRFRFEGEEILTVPHPRLVERRFVLEPLAELAPDLGIPGLGTLCELLAKANDQVSHVLRLEDAVLSVQRK